MEVYDYLDKVLDYLSFIIDAEGELKTLNL
jgi:hypothetical protein